MLVDTEFEITPNRDDADCQIVFGAHRCLEPLKNAIIFQGEQPASPYFTENYKRLLANALHVFDHIPCRTETTHDPSWSYLTFPVTVQAVSKVAKSCDVLFYGAGNYRRHKIAEDFRKSDLISQFHLGYTCFGSVRDEAIAKSKIILNIHFYNNPVLEQHRINHLLASGALVVSERSEYPEVDKIYENVVYFSKLKDFVTTCQNLIKRMNADPDFIGRHQNIAIDFAQKLMCKTKKDLLRVLRHELPRHLEKRSDNDTENSKLKVFRVRSRVSIEVRKIFLVLNKWHES